MKVTFLGAAQTVTGSRYLVSTGKLNVLVDCGLFEGYKSLRLKNWNPFPIDPKQIDAVLLTHAHLDHSGYIPRLRNYGFRGPVYCTSATKDLCMILLPDCGHLQEEEANYANKRGYSKHKPALPLYTKEDAIRSLENFETVPWKTPTRIGDMGDRNSLEFEFHPAGHLLGAASISIKSDGRRILFSGDLGRISDPLTRLPSCRIETDVLVVESTYGNRIHLETNVKSELEKIIRRTWERRGTLLIPSFAVGRAQLMLYYIHSLKSERLIPNIPVYLNSPMAIHAGKVFLQHHDESKVSKEQAQAICDGARPIASVEESQALVASNEPKIIVAASGMATGGRVLHHLNSLAPDPKNTILFCGFQAGGTRGETLTTGASEVKIFGKYVPVRAEVLKLDSMSAHADGGEILEWISQLTCVPKQVFITHGEPSAAEELRRRIADRFVTDVQVANLGQSFEF